MEKKIIPFIYSAENGYYGMLVPDYTTNDFVKTIGKVKAAWLTPFGFDFKFEYCDPGDPVKYDNSGGEYRKEISARAFKTFVEKLQLEAERKGAGYILVDLRRNSEASSYKWLIEAHCQYYMTMEVPDDEEIKFIHTSLNKAVQTDLKEYHSEI